MTWLQENAIWLIGGMILALLGGWFWRDRTNRREQRRLLGRLRYDSEQQARALLTLNRALEETMRQIGEHTGEMSERQDHLRDVLDSRIDALRQSNEQKLEQMREAVSEKLELRLNESFRGINRQLADVNRGLGQMRAMAGELADMKRVLGGVKSRGVWGELQLRTLLQELLAPSQYIENAAIPEGAQTRVEFAVRIPASDGEALLPIDSKFPQEDFLRLTDASAMGDVVRMEACAARLERTLMEQAKAISSKYIRPPQTVDFAIMFLPVESLYAEAVRRPGMCERLQNQYRVLVAGPNTLAALLTSLRAGFRSVNLERRSGEVLQLLNEVRLELTHYEEKAALVRRRLAQVDEALDALDVHARKLSKQLRDLAEDIPE